VIFQSKKYPIWTMGYFVYTFNFKMGSGGLSLEQ